MQLISGDTTAAFAKQTATLVKSCGKDLRDQILKDMAQKIVIPSDSAAAMKATLNVPWNQMREISRWLATFNVKLASEKETRKVAKEWVGEGLKAELAPLTQKVAGKKRIEIITRPWAYLYNIVAHILLRLDHLEQYEQIFHHAFIPPGEIHIKIGGDHGGNNFKMAYQIGNMKHPNRKENTTIFSIFEAKDSVSNLRICLDRYKAQIRLLQTKKWKDHVLRIFLYGDY